MNTLYVRPICIIVLLTLLSLLVFLKKFVLPTLGLLVIQGAREKLCFFLIILEIQPSWAAIGC